MSVSQEERQDSQEEGPAFQSGGAGTLTSGGYPEIDYPDKEDEVFLDCDDSELPASDLSNPTGLKGIMSESYAAELNDRDIADEDLIRNEEEGEFVEALSHDTPALQPGEMMTMMPEEMEGEFHEC